MLPPSAAKPFLGRAFGSSQDKFSDIWAPSKEQILKMEEKLPDIKKLKQWRTKDPEDYFMQYVPLLRGGEKLIFINAFQDPDPVWKEGIIFAYDGGDFYWRVFYDTATEKFFDLRFNGHA